MQQRQSYPLCRCVVVCVIWLIGQLALAWCGVAMGAAMYEYSHHASTTASSVRSSQPWACGDCVPNEPRYSCIHCSVGRHSAQLTAKTRGIEIAAQTLSTWLPVVALQNALLRQWLVKIVYFAVASHEWSLLTGVAFTSLWLSKVWGNCTVVPALHKWLDARDSAQDEARRRRTSILLAERAAVSLAPTATASIQEPDQNSDEKQIPGVLRRRTVMV